MMKLCVIFKLLQFLHQLIEEKAPILYKQGVKSHLHKCLQQIRLEDYFRDIDVRIRLQNPEKHGIQLLLMSFFQCYHMHRCQNLYDFVASQDSMSYLFKVINQILIDFEQAKIIFYAVVRIA